VRITLVSRHAISSSSTTTAGAYASASYFRVFGGGYRDERWTTAGRYFGRRLDQHGVD
jgi:hypothetical protein